MIRDMFIHNTQKAKQNKNMLRDILQETIQKPFLTDMWGKCLSELNLKAEENAESQERLKLNIEHH